MWHFTRQVCALVVLSVLTSNCTCQPDIANRDSRGSTIICFGDSLTEGLGARPGYDYPSLLAKALGREVINAGVSGNTTQDALNRLEQDVLTRDPQLVIVQLGGNDFLRKVSWKETFKNLDEIVGRIQERGAMVVLIGVQPGLLGDAARKDYQRIAKRRRAAFVSNILEGILTNPQLRSDHLHPNDQGYERIAERIVTIIKPLIGRESY